MPNQNTYKYKVDLSRRFSNLSCFIGYDPKSLAYTTEENPEFGEIVGNIFAEEYEATENLHRFRLKVERKLFVAKELLLKKPRCHLLLSVRCITAATPERDLIIATYMDLQPLKPFIWPRTCPTEILFYAIIQEKVKGKNLALYENLQTTPRVISTNFSWLYEKADPLACSSTESSLYSGSGQDCDDFVEEPTSSNPENPPKNDDRYSDADDEQDPDEC